MPAAPPSETSEARGLPPSARVSSWAWHGFELDAADNEAAACFRVGDRVFVPERRADVGEVVEVGGRSALLEVAWPDGERCVAYVGDVAPALTVAALAVVEDEGEGVTDEDRGRARAWFGEPGASLARAFAEVRRVTTEREAEGWLRVLERMTAERLALTRELARARRALSLVAEGMIHGAAVLDATTPEGGAR